MVLTTGTSRDFGQERKQGGRNGSYIMEHFHQYVPISCDQYVPCIDKTVKVSYALGRPILFSGDQLTAARARGAQKAKVNSPSP